MLRKQHFEVAEAARNGRIQPVAKHDPHEQLSRRERQIMDILWRRGTATAAEIQEEMAEAPSYSAVRALLAILVEKGHAESVQEGRRYVYRPTASRDRVRQQALGRLLATFFDDSAEALVETLLSRKDRKLSPEALERLRKKLDGDGGAQ